MRFNRVISREFFAVLGAGAALGFLLGVGVAGAVFLYKASPLVERLKQSAARVAMLEGILARPVDFAALDLDRGASPASALPVESGPGPQGPASVRKPPASPPAASVVAPAPLPRTLPVPAAVTTARPAGTPREVPVAVDRVSPEEVASAVATGRVEGVSAAKARVAKITSEGVYLGNGQLVRPGERFPSGERLLQVDPENNRVVTNERQLLLFF